MVVAYINEEFFQIQNEEMNRMESIIATTQKTTQKTTPKTTQKNKTRERILELLSDNPYLTRTEIADLIGISQNGVKYHINKLKEIGRIRRSGGNKGGYWIIENLDGQK